MKVIISRWWFGLHDCAFIVFIFCFIFIFSCAALNWKYYFKTYLAVRNFVGWKWRKKFLPMKIFTEVLFLQTNIFYQRIFSGGKLTWAFLSRILKVYYSAMILSCRSKVSGSLTEIRLLIYSEMDPIYWKK